MFFSLIEAWTKPVTSLSSSSSSLPSRAYRLGCWLAEVTPERGLTWSNVEAAGAVLVCAILSVPYYLCHTISLQGHCLCHTTLQGGACTILLVPYYYFAGAVLVPYFYFAGDACAILLLCRGTACAIQLCRGVLVPYYELLFREVALHWEGASNTSQVCFNTAIQHNIPCVYCFLPPHYRGAPKTLQFMHALPCAVDPQNTSGLFSLLVTCSFVPATSFAQSLTLFVIGVIKFLWLSIWVSTREQRIFGLWQVQEQ